MELLLKRKPANDDAILGEFFVDGLFEAFALERASLAIPANRYPVHFTVSNRAARGELWSPDPEHRLPLIDEVPGRSGIRIHAANDSEELIGCVALGQSQSGVRLQRSRAAVAPFIEKIAAADARQEEIFITVVDPEKVTALVA